MLGGKPFPVKSICAIRKRRKNEAPVEEELPKNKAGRQPAPPVSKDILKSEVVCQSLANEQVLRHFLRPDKTGVEPTARSVIMSDLNPFTAPLAGDKHDTVLYLCHNFVIGAGPTAHIGGVYLDNDCFAV